MGASTIAAKWVAGPLICTQEQSLAETGLAHQQEHFRLAFLIIEERIHFRCQPLAAYKVLHAHALEDGIRTNV